MERVHMAYIFAALRPRKAEFENQLIDSLSILETELLILTPAQGMTSIS